MLTKYIAMLCKRLLPKVYPLAIQYHLPNSPDAMQPLLLSIPEIYQSQRKFGKIETGFGYADNVQNAFKKLDNVVQTAGKKRMVTKSLDNG